MLTEEWPASRLEPHLSWYLWAAYVVVFRTLSLIAKNSSVEQKEMKKKYILELETQMCGISSLFVLVLVGICVVVMVSAHVV